MAENVTDFARRIKTKYPEYKDIGDLELATRIVDKYPEYKDKVTFGEVATPSPVMPFQQPDAFQYQEQAPAPVAPAPESGSWLKNKFKSMGGAVGGMVEMAGGAMSAVGTLTKKIYGGDDKIANFEKGIGSSVTDYGKKMAEYYKVQDPTFADKLAGAAASGLTFLVPGMGVMRGVKILSLAPKLAALAAAGGSSVFESGLEAGGVYNTIIDKGGSEEEALAAASKTFASNVGLNTALNYGGGLMHKMLPGAKAGTIKDVALSAGRATGAEALQEGSQQVISNVFGEEPTWQGVGESALLGGLVGGGMSGVMDVANRLDQGPAAPTPKLPIPPTISPTVLERARAMGATDPIAAIKSVLPASEWGNIDELGRQVLQSVEADQSVPVEQKQVISANILNSILENSLPQPQVEQAPEAPASPEQAAEQDMISQLVAEREAEQATIEQDAATSEILSQPEPAVGKPVMDMSEAEFSQMVLADNPEATGEDISNQYDEAMSEAKRLNLVDDRFLAEVNGPDLQAMADREVELPEGHEFDMTPTEPSTSLPAMALEQAQAKFPGLTEEQHKSMVKDAIDAYAIDSKNIPYPDLKAYALSKEKAEQAETFVKDELTRQMQEKGHVTPILNMLFRSKINKADYDKNFGGDLDLNEMRGYFSTTGGITISNATERAWGEGWIAENDENMFLDALDAEVQKREVIRNIGIKGEIAERVTATPEAMPAYMEEGVEYQAGGIPYAPGHVYQPNEMLATEAEAFPQGNKAATEQAIADTRTVSPVGNYWDLRDNPIIGQMAQDIINKGFTSAIGKRIDTIQDAAEIAAFGRHPLIEHLSVIKLKKGKVVGFQVFSSGKVAEITPDDSAIQDFVADADEFYMSHNHPSGNATPSTEDIASTKAMAADKRFKGHVVSDHQTYTAIMPDGTAIAQQYKGEKESFRKDIEKMASAPAVVGWARGSMQGEHLGIMFVDNQLQVMSFDQVDPRSDYNLYIKRHSNRYGATGVFLVAGEAAHAKMSPRRLHGNYHDMIVMKNDGSYMSAALGYVKGFNVSKPTGMEGDFEALGYAETGANYNPEDYNKMTGRYKPGMDLTLRSRLTNTQFPKGLPRGTAGKLVSVDTASGEMLVDFNGKITVANPSMFAETFRKPPATPTGKPDAEPLAPGEKPLKFINTVKGFENVAPEVKDAISGTYSVITNDASLLAAKDIIAKDYNAALKMVFEAGVSVVPSSVTQAVSAEIFFQFQRERNFVMADKIIEHIAKISKNSGQTIQFLAAMRWHTPEGILRYAKAKVLDSQVAGKFGDLIAKMNSLKTDEERADFAKKHKIPYMSKKQSEELYDESVAISKMPEGYDKELATGVMLRHVSEIIPKTFWEKVAAIQRMGQLLALKTFDRNIIGNISFAALDSFNTFAIAVPMDIIVSKVAGRDRTVTTPSWTAYKTGMMQGVVNGYREAMAGVDLSEMHNKYDLPNGFTFTNPFMRIAEKTLSLSLRATDKMFYTAQRTNYIQGQMELARINNKKLEIPTPEMLESAHLSGLYITFNDPNVLRSAMTGLKKGLTKLSDIVFRTGGKWGAGNQVINYPGTPSSIVMRAVDYSPFNLLQSLYILYRGSRGKGFDQEAFVLSTSRSFTGSAFIVGTGYMLAMLGIMSGKNDKDRKARNLKLATGVRGYQINLSSAKRLLASGFNADTTKRQYDDMLVSYDWFQPMAIGFAMGANIYESQKETGDLNIIGSTASAMQTITEQPLLQGLQRLFMSRKVIINGHEIEGMGVVAGIVNTLKDVPASFMPQALNAVRQFMDNTSRNQNSPDFFTEMGNSIKVKIPGLSKDLPANVDILGRVRQNYQNDTNNAFNVFLNPAFVSRYKPTRTTDLVLDIWARSGETIQIPRIAPKSITVQGVRRPLTEFEQQHFQNYIGATTANIFSNLSRAPGFMALPDSVKAKDLEGILTDVYNEGKWKVLGVR